MRRTVVTLLLASSLATPVLAQDTQDQHKDHPQKQERQSRPDQPRPDRPPQPDQGGRPDRGPAATRPDRGPAMDRPDRGPRPGLDRPDRGPGPDRPDRGPGPDRPDRTPPRPGNDRGPDRPDRMPPRGNDGWRDDRRPDNGRPNYGRPNYGRPGHAHAPVRNWSRNWRADRRYDWQGYRSANRSLFRGPRWYAPRGAIYRRFNVGWRFDPIFYDESYWITDPWAYRLPPADYPYEWVRYYNDVALVDVRSGEIVDMIYSFFW